MNSQAISDFKSLAQLSLAKVLSRQPDPFFPLLAENLEEVIQAGFSEAVLIEQCRLQDPLLGQYILRTIRTVAAEEQIASADEGENDQRLILFGVGVFLPDGFRFDSNSWASSLEVLESGLAGVWANDINRVAVMPAAMRLELLATLSAKDVRKGLLELYSGSWSQLFEPVEIQCDSPYAPYIIPAVVSVPVATANVFYSEYLLPKATVALLAGIKHRLEEVYADEPELTPIYVPPCGWANVFPLNRNLQAKKSVQVKLATSAQPASSWELRARVNSLSLINRETGTQTVFPFPDETPRDIAKLAEHLSATTGIAFVSRL